MREKLLSIIEKNSRINISDLSRMLHCEEIDIVNELQKLEEDRIILKDVEYNIIKEYQLT